MHTASKADEACCPDEACFVKTRKRDEKTLTYNKEYFNLPSPYTVFKVNLK